MDNEFDKIKEALDKIKPAEFEWTSDSKDMGIIAQEIGDVLEDTIIIDTSLWGSGTININSTSGPYTIGSAGSYLYNGSNGSSMWSTSVGTNTPSLSVTGNAEFDQDVKIKGISVLKTLEEINRRLAILVPDPEKLEHFEALKKAYEHYKTLEALCQVPAKDDNS
jgi:hypothetical protein